MIANGHGVGRSCVRAGCGMSAGIRSRIMNRASFINWPPDGSLMSRAAGVFLSAVLSVTLIGVTSAGAAAAEPVATAPIPPPLPAEPPAPDTPMMVPATPAPKPNSPGSKTDASGRAAGVSKTKHGTGAVEAKRKQARRPAAAERAARSKGPASRYTSQHTATRKTPRRKLAAEEAAVAAAADAAERDTARRRAAELRREGSHGAGRASRQGYPVPPAWAASPDRDTTYGSGNSGDPLHNQGPYPEGAPPRPDRIAGGRPGAYADYPGPPMFYGPAYPPPWYNGVRPEYYPDQWNRGPMAPW